MNLTPDAITLSFQETAYPRSHYNSTLSAPFFRKNGIHFPPLIFLMKVLGFPATNINPIPIYTIVKASNGLATLIDTDEKEII